MAWYASLNRRCSKSVQSVADGTHLVVCIGQLAWECVKACRYARGMRVCKKIPVRRDGGQRLQARSHANTQCDGHGVADMDRLAPGGAFVYTA